LIDEQTINKYCVIYDELYYSTTANNITMGKTNNKYHITDDGKIYRINEDGSFTEVHIADNVRQESKSIKVTAKDGWFKNNWLLVLSCVLTIVWAIFAIRFSSWRDHHMWDYVDHSATVFSWGILLIAYNLVIGLFTSNLLKNPKSNLRLNFILIIGFVIVPISVSLTYIEGEYKFPVSVFGILATVTLLIYVIKKIIKQ